MVKHIKIDTDYWEDLVFTYRLVTHVTKVVLLPDITYSYYCRENSLSHYQQRATIGKDEVMRNVKAVDCLKADAAPFLCVCAIKMMGKRKFN